MGRREQIRHSVDEDATHFMEPSRVGMTDENWIAVAEFEFSRRALCGIRDWKLTTHKAEDVSCGDCLRALGRAPNPREG